MKDALSPDLLTWREAHIRRAALQARYRTLYRRPGTPVTVIVAALKATEAAQEACRRLNIHAGGQTKPDRQQRSRT